MEKEREQELIQKALEAKEKAYVPYSKFKVGAALKTSSGKIFTGCNIENASFGLTNCAERTAIFKAVSEGHTDIESIAVVTDIDDYASPCGACRQVMAEFGLQIKVLMGNKDGDYYIKTSGELLPGSFTNQQLESNKK
ncbi:cytidine deaminase [Alkaliphilus crotonatoxidans]